MERKHSTARRWGVALARRVLGLVSSGPRRSTDSRDSASAAAPATPVSEVPNAAAAGNNAVEMGGEVMGNGVGAPREGAQAAEVRGFNSVRGVA